MLINPLRDILRNIVTIKAAEERHLQACRGPSLAEACLTALALPSRDYMHTLVTEISFTTSFIFADWRWKAKNTLSRTVCKVAMQVHLCMTCPRFNTNGTPYIHDFVVSRGKRGKSPCLSNGYFDHTAMSKKKSKKLEVSIPTYSPCYV